MMRSVFFGTSGFAVPSLRVLAQRTDVVCVVTQPDRPAGRGHRLQSTPVKRAALELGLRVEEPQRLRDFAASLEGQSIDLFALASYGKILPQILLDLPRLGALNVHPSLLPRYRGATPLQSALLAGERETGVSVMLMDAGMDTGDLVLCERTQIGASESYGELHDRLAEYGARLLGEALDLAAHAPLPRHPQRGEASVTAPLGKNDLAIDWSWPAPRIVDAVRAFSPQPAARALLGAIAVKLRRAHMADESAQVSRESGSVACVDGALLVRCGEGLIAIDELIAPNRGVESGAHFYERLNATVPS